MEPEITPQQEELVHFELDPNAKQVLRQERIKQVKEDLTAEFSIQFQKLTEQSVKYKQHIIDAKTGVKNSYYEKKLHRNNEKISVLLEEFENTMNHINTLIGEVTNVEPQSD